MKYLLKSVVIVALALFLGNAANAQTREVTPSEETTELFASLDLNEEQIAQVEELEVRFAEKKMEIKTTSPNADEAGKNLKELKSAYYEELKAILSPEQLEKWKTMQPQDGE